MTPLSATRLGHLAAIGILTFLMTFGSAALIPTWADKPVADKHMKNLQELAEKGDAKAQYELAQAYFDGKGVALDYVKALRWLLAAEKQGYHRLGTMALDYKIAASYSPEKRDKIEKAVEIKKAFEDSLEQAQRTGDLNEQALCFLIIGTIWTTNDETDRKLICLENALEAYRKIGDQHGEMITLMEMGESVSDSKQGLEYATQSLEVARKIGSTKGKREALERIVSLYQGLKKPQEALAFLKSGLDIEKQNNDLAGMTQYLARIAKVHDSMEQHQSAKDSCEEAARIAQKDGQIQSLVTVCDTCRFIKQAGDQMPAWHVQLVSLLEQALQVSQSTGDTWAEMMILHRMGLAFYFSDAPAKSVKSWERASELAGKNQHLDEEYYFLNIVQGRLLDQCEYQRVLTCNERKLAIAKQSGWAAKEIATLCDIARFYSSVGRHEKAIKEYEKALEQRHRFAGTEKDGHLEKPHRVLHEMAKSYLELAQFKKAIELCEKSLVERDRTKLKTDGERAWADREDGGVFETMGEAYIRLGESDKAIDCFIGAWWRKKGEAPLSWAQLYLNLGRTEEAEVMAGDGQWGGAGLARFFLQKGDYDKAREYYEKMVAGSEKIGRVDGLFIAYTGLGRVYEAQEHYKKAEEYYEKAERLAERMASNLPPAERKNLYGAKVGLRSYGPVASFRRSEPAEGLARIRMKMGGANRALTPVALQGSLFRPRLPAAITVLISCRSTRSESFPEISCHICL